MIKNHLVQFILSYLYGSDDRLPTVNLEAQFPEFSINSVQFFLNSGHQLWFIEFVTDTRVVFGWVIMQPKLFAFSRRREVACAVLSMLRIHRIILY